MKSRLLVVAILAPILASPAVASPDAAGDALPKPYLVRDIDLTGEPVDLCPPVGIPPGHQCVFYGGLPRGFTPLGDRVVFVANDRLNGFEPWVSDGTAAGTHLLRDLGEGERYGLRILGSVAEHVYFSAPFDGARAKLWRTDGTTPGTVDATAFCEEPCPRFEPYWPVLLEEGALWIAGESTRSGGEAPAASAWLWRLDLETGETAPVFELFDGVGPCRLWLDDLVRRDDDVVVLVDPNCGPHELWRIPGGNGEPEQVSFEDPADPDVLRVDSAGRLLLFSDRAPGFQARVWAAEPGSYDLALLAELPGPFVTPVEPELSGRTYFLIPSSDGNAELWATDGSAAGTGPVLTGVASEVPPVRLGDRLLLAADLPVAGRSLVSLGADGGVSTLAFGEVSHLEVSGDWAVVNLQEPVAGAEPWVTDGTTEGTRRLADLYPGPESSDPWDFTATESGLVFFSAFHPDTDRELWAVALPRPIQPPPPPPDDLPWLSDPALDGFRVKVRIVHGPGASIPGTTEAACIPETLCVSGALPGRSEVFVRVLGPKPNGRLWPILVKFTTSEVEVWIEQLATEEIRYYRLEGARPGFDELPGLFDRFGFEP